MRQGGAPTETPVLYRALRAVLPLILRPLLKVRTEGATHVPVRGPCVLASNHLSALDPIVLSLTLDRPVIYLAKMDYLRGWQRFFFSQVGVVGVERAGGRPAEAALRTGQAVLQMGWMLAIYPEGTRSPDGRLYRGKTGAVRLALRSDAPLVPVACVGTDDVLPPGAHLPRRRGAVTLRFGPPLDLRPFCDTEGRYAVRPATDALMAAIRSLSGQAYVDEYIKDVPHGAAAVGEQARSELDDLADEVIERGRSA